MQLKESDSNYQNQFHQRGKTQEKHPTHHKGERIKDNKGKRIVLTMKDSPASSRGSTVVHWCRHIRLHEQQYPVTIKKRESYQHLRNRKETVLNTNKTDEKTKKSENVNGSTEWQWWQIHEDSDQLVVATHRKHQKPNETKTFRLNQRLPEFAGSENSQKIPMINHKGRIGRKPKEQIYKDLFSDTMLEARIYQI